LGGVTAQAGDVIPVGQTIAWILAAGEQPPAQVSTDAQTKPQTAPRNAGVETSPLARKIAEEHGIDLALIKSNGKRIEKADVLAYINATSRTTQEPTAAGTVVPLLTRLTPASPKARRLATERGIDIRTIKGSGHDGAVLANDAPLEVSTITTSRDVETPSTLWRMAERMTSSWTNVPHFYLMREVDARILIEWRSVSSTVERSGIDDLYRPAC
jgi:pyruvate dehydrogenase E2 component (dihydrolipoamide acetyltransferase)